MLRIIHTLRITLASGAEVDVGVNRLGMSTHCNVTPYVHAKRLIDVRAGDELMVDGKREAVTSIRVVVEGRLTEADARRCRAEGYIYRLRDGAECEAG